MMPREEIDAAEAEVPWSRFLFRLACALVALVRRRRR